MADSLADAVACATEVDEVPAPPQELIKRPFEYLVWGNWVSGAPLFTNGDVSRLAKSALYVSATYDLDSGGYHTQVALMVTSEKEMSDFELVSAWYNRLNGVFWNGDVALPQPHVSCKSLGDQLMELIAENVQ